MTDRHFMEESSWESLTQLHLFTYKLWMSSLDHQAVSGLIADPAYFISHHHIMRRTLQLLTIYGLNSCIRLGFHVCQLARKATYL